MSREIRFRAWDNKEKRMYDWSNIMTGFMQGFFTDAYDVELMQYTGLKDRNGQEIYGGDIVKALKHNENSFTNKVLWRSGVFWFGNWNWIEFQNIFREIEILGNKFEHPHLLDPL